MNLFPRLELGNTWAALKTIWRSPGGEPEWEAELAGMRDRTPAPTLWLFGKTQSGKTSLVRQLTQAADAEIGSGFRPCTLTTREYPFPTADAPLMTFLDTRGVDEADYDPADDLARLGGRADLVIVTSRLRDFTHGHLRDSLKAIRAADRDRPVLLVLTCLHEAFPQQQHPEPYPFLPLDESVTPGAPAPPVVNEDALPADLLRLVREQSSQFRGLVDRVVPVDFTRPVEGFTNPEYGAEALREAILASLPQAYRTTLARATELAAELRSLHHRRTAPLILGYATLAGSAGAIPVPFLDLVLLPAIQARMVQQLARLSGAELTGEQFLSAVRALGLGIVARQALRECVKFIPFVGVPASAALASQATYALGVAFCDYLQEAHRGHLPSQARLRELYQTHLTRAGRAWGRP